jgi:hypothetical protein
VDENSEKWYTPYMPTIVVRKRKLEEDDGHLDSVGVLEKDLVDLL